MHTVHKDQVFKASRKSVRLALSRILYLEGRFFGRNVQETCCVSAAEVILGQEIRAAVGRSLGKFLRPPTSRRRNDGTTRSSDACQQLSSGARSSDFYQRIQRPQATDASTNMMDPEGRSTDGPAVAALPPAATPLSAGTSCAPLKNPRFEPALTWLPPEDVKDEPQQPGGLPYLNLMATVQNALKRQREAEPAGQGGDAKRTKTEPEPAPEPSMFDIGSMLESALVSYDAQQSRSTPGAEGALARGSASPRPLPSAPTPNGLPQDRKRPAARGRQDLDYLMRFMLLPSLGSKVRPGCRGSRRHAIR